MERRRNSFKKKQNPLRESEPAEAGGPECRESSRQVLKSLVVIKQNNPKNKEGASREVKKEISEEEKKLPNMRCGAAIMQHGAGVRTEGQASSWFRKRGRAGEAQEGYRINQTGGKPKQRQGS